MIIKSMARKAPTFAQLIAYIGRDADSAPGAKCTADHEVAVFLKANRILHRTAPGRRSIPFGSDGTGLVCSISEPVRRMTDEH